MPNHVNDPGSKAEEGDFISHNKIALNEEETASSFNEDGINGALKVSEKGGGKGGRSTEETFNNDEDPFNEEF